MKREAIIARLRQTLIKRRSGLRRSLDRQQSLLPAAAEQPVGDIVDAAGDWQQDEINFQLAEAESRELAKIENALERMQTGQYGSCESCGGRISLARLQALPYATLCIDCRRKEEQYRTVRATRHSWEVVSDVMENGDEPRIRDVLLDKF